MSFIYVTQIQSTINQTVAPSLTLSERFENEIKYKYAQQILVILHFYCNSLCSSLSLGQVISQKEKEMPGFKGQFSLICCAL